MNFSAAVWAAPLADVGVSRIGLAAVYSVMGFTGPYLFLKSWCYKSEFSRAVGSNSARTLG